MPPKIANPRKQFQFNVIIPGLNPFLVQDVKTPDVDFDSTEHGDTGFLVKTAGMKKLGTMTITGIHNASAPDLDVFLRVWSRDIMNTTTGGGLPPSNYKKPIIIEEFGNDGITVVNRETYLGCWPQKINGKDLSRRGSDNTTRSIEFQVDEEA
jgi:hypothetical protein